MSNSSFKTLVTNDSLLSPHVNSLGKAITRLEDLLGVGTDSVEDHAMTAVTDQSVIALRYRIYYCGEGFQNWIGTPVIKRDAVTVDSSEYSLHLGFGVVIFHSAQSPSASITANFDYIKDSTSSVIDEVNRVNGRPIYLENVYKSAAKAYRSTTVSLDTYYFLPFIIPYTMTFDRIGTDIISGIAGNMCIMVYDDDNGYPGSLLFSDTIGLASTGVTVISEDITLNRGLYWIGFNCGGFGTPDIQGVVSAEIEPIGSDWNPVKNYVGYYKSDSYTDDPPNPFSAGASYLTQEDNTYIGAIFIRRKAS